MIIIINAFEPIKLTYDKFNRNIKNNELKKKIFTHNFGLSNRNNFLKMNTNIKFGYKQSAGYFVSEEGEEEAEFKIADEFLNYTKKTILIKIDTEGHESFVLQGMTKLINNNKIFLQVEIWDVNFKIVKGQLDKLGFVFIKRIKNDYYFSKKLKI